MNQFEELMFAIGLLVSAGAVWQFIICPLSEKLDAWSMKRAYDKDTTDV